MLAMVGHPGDDRALDRHRAEDREQPPNARARLERAVREEAVEADRDAQAGRDVHDREHEEVVVAERRAPQLPGDQSEGEHGQDGHEPGAHAGDGLVGDRLDILCRGPCDVNCHQEGAPFRLKSSTVAQRSAGSRSRGCARGQADRMRQLTSLDAQFLAVESARVYGHVGSMAVYDPRTAPGGSVEIGDVCRLLGERIHQLPPFRWKLVEVPFGLDLPYWIEDPDFDLDFHIRESAVPPPGDEVQLARTVARIFARPLDRNRPLWELYLIHGLKGGKVAMLTKVHHSVVDGVAGNEILSVLLDRQPRRARGRARARRARDRARARRARDARARRRRPAAPAAAGAALDPLGGAQPRQPARRERVPGRAHARARDDARARRARRPRGRRDPRGHHRAPAAHELQRARLAAPQLRLRHDVAEHDQEDQGRRRGHRQRRRGLAVRGRGARMAAGARRAARRAARVARARVGAQRGADGRLRQPHLGDGGADRHRRRRPEGAPAAHARAAGERQGAPRRAARRPADRRDELHPADAAVARGEGDDGDPRADAPAAEPGDLQRARPARATCTSRARAWSSSCPCRPSSTASA